MKKIFLIALLAMTLPAHSAHASAPTITTFTASPSTIGNNYSISVAWNIDNSAGGELMFTCPLGVYVKTDAGAEVNCGSRITISSAVGSLGYVVTNVSGSTKNLSVTLYPKDTQSVLYDSNSSTVSVSVTTAALPISDFTTSSSSVSSGSPVTLTWQGLDAPGMTLIFDCADSVRLYAGTITTGVSTLPCNTEFQSTDLPTSGSYTFTPLNSTLTARSLNVTLRPAMAPGSYDASHGKSLGFTVLGTPPVPDPSITSLSATPLVVGTSTSVALSWTTTNIKKVALQIQCVAGLSFFDSASTSTTPLSCNTPSLIGLTSSGSTTLTVKNADVYPRPVTLSLFPQTDADLFLANLGKTISVLIPVTGVAPVIALQPVPSATTAATSTPKKASAHAPFTRALKRGQKDSDVTRLQTFLALNPLIYPEGNVTGYFGPATERAVQRFQEKYGIVKKGGEGYGNAGPATRAKLNLFFTP